ncbi:hypothetical protein [Marinilabilia sp.]|uniref:hypothetical protein n=1 Tax=Marinilabilia sp. TaxID=2021252 RepID=UPI0025BC128A|nr:hypothetical protein [Marinilabilia sp.]
MKNFRVIKLSTMCSTKKLTQKVELILNEKANAGFEIVTVAFGTNIWYMPTAYITYCEKSV